jgi:hypothetical protein
LEVGFELLSEHTDLEVLGDKAYISAAEAGELWENNRILLRTIPRSNQKQPVPEAFEHLHNAFRQLIETVNGQLAGNLPSRRITPIPFGACAPVWTAS